MGVGPTQVHAACDAATDVLTAAQGTSAVTGTQQEWAAAAAAAQRVIDAATAVQDDAIARLAAIEPELLDDGTWVDTHKAPGHVALDSAAILSGALNVSTVHAERRVTAAVAMAADGPEGTSTHTGLAGLHTAMQQGRIDRFRASVIADELDLAPPQVREAVIAAIEPWFRAEDAAHLRRRTRRHLARISPDLLRQRAQRARAESGLHRWADEPGVDKWVGTFPSEEAATAWAAIDHLAQQYLADGTCATIERARAKALTDLVAGNSTAIYHVTLTIPALAGTGEDERAAADRPGPSPAEELDRANGAEVCPVSLAEEDQATERPDTTAGRASRPGDLVEVGGLGPSGTTLVARSWLDAVLASPTCTTRVALAHPTTGALLGHPQPEPGSRRDRRLRRDRRDESSPTDAHTGQPPPGTGYRPGRRIVSLVKARDGRCRFPGCTINARFCDLDHVRPWPTGPTATTNLVCLCRRHHRIKQRHGWHATLHPDRTLTWTDPTGRHRTTWPLDALHGIVLHHPTTDDADRAHDVRQDDDRLATSPAGTGTRNQPHSHLEFRLEHLAAGIPATPATATPTYWRDHHGRRHHADLQRIPSTAVLRIDPHAPWPHQRPRPGSRTRFDGPPPF